MFFEARKASSRSSKLAGVLLLRKVPQLVSADHIETIMKSVPRKATIAEGPSWRCRYWIWNALDVSMDSIEDALDLMILQSLVSESINHWHSRGCLGY